MQSLPTDWLSLLILTFVLGMKHGFDADHLATIDGLTRFNAKNHPSLAPYCGTYFSLGHGAVVLIIALGVSIIAEHWVVPDWFSALGSIISIIFLVLLGCLNLFAVLRAEPDQVVLPIGIKRKLLGNLRYAAHPLLIAFVGSLFALSFDTLSQAAFFALTATQFGGWGHALLLSTLFILGMLLTDGINGVWIARLIARADQVALIASRVMGLVVSAVSLLVAALSAARMLSPAANLWADGKELIFGFTLVAIIAVSFLLAMRITSPLRH